MDGWKDGWFDGWTDIEKKSNNKQYFVCLSVGDFGLNVHII